MKVVCLSPVFAACAMLCAALAAVGAEPQKDAACKITDYRVVSSGEVDLYCNPRPITSLAGTVRLTEVDDEGRPGASISGRFSLAERDRHWLQVTELQAPLKPKTKYQISDAAEKEPEAFEAFSFDTKPTATVTMKQPDETPGGRCNGSDRLVVLQSKIALAPDSLPGAQLSLADGSLQRLNLKPMKADVEDRQEIGRAEGCSSFSVGVRLSKKFTLAKVRNIFADEIKATGAYKTSKAPADQASSSYYAKFDGQAGQGQTPGYTIEGKIAPDLQYVGKGFYLTPNADADLGLGSSDDAKVTDMIKAGGGVSRFFPSWSTEFEPSIQYETDRHGEHRNLLFDGQAQYFGKGWRHTIAEQNYENFAKLSIKGGPDAPKSVDEVASATHGWQLELFAGMEAGGTFSNDTVKSSDKKTSVVLPHDAIARVRPNASWTGEYKRASVNLNITPRYLFPDENVTREVKTPIVPGSTTTFQKIYVIQTSGLRTFGEGTFLLNFDPAGHFAWSVTYKAGSEPPNFDHVNMVETGLTLIY